MMINYELKSPFGYYYFDIETVPLERFKEEEQASFAPSKSKIITIQYQPLDVRTGIPNSELVILKEWDQHSSEKVIVDRFKPIFLDKGIWSFIPVGNNLLFESRFMKFKFKQYFGLDKLFLGHRPMVDLKHILIIMNDGRFKGCAELIGKSGQARNIAQWYKDREFGRIEDYIIEEAKNFNKVYSLLKAEVPKLRYLVDPYAI